MSRTPSSVVVLGMHRSGTSLVTGLLGRLGLFLPSASDLYAPSEFNPRGNQEVMELTAMNERILHALGGEWSAPPLLSSGWLDEPAVAALREPARAVFDRFMGTRPWVWKDPRLCLLWPFWQQLLDEQPLMLLVVRNPLETANSLRRRDDFDECVSVALWERYCRGALQAAQGQWVAATTYEAVLEDPDGWALRAREQLAGAGLGLPDSERSPPASQFAERSFRRTSHTRDELATSPWVSGEQLALYDTLCALPEVSDPFAGAGDAGPCTAWATALLEERRRGRQAHREAQRRLHIAQGRTAGALVRRAVRRLRGR
ncbi:MAG: hypothetical protein AAF628_09140 [Planctomycetota bacterium]